MGIAQAIRHRTLKEDRSSHSRDCQDVEEHTLPTLTDPIIWRVRVMVCISYSLHLYPTDETLLARL